MSISISSAQEKRLNAIAAKTGKTPQAIIRAAIEAYLERGEWLEKAILQGIESATKEARVPHDQVWQNFEKRREQHLKKQRKAA